MKAAQVTRAVVVFEQKAQSLVLYLVAESQSEAMNLRAPFDWETLDQEWFLHELRDKIAKGLDVASSQVELGEDLILRRMQFYHDSLEKGGTLQ